MATSDLLIRIQANITQAVTQVKALNTQINGLGKSANTGATLSQNLDKARPAGIALAGAAALLDGGLLAALTTATDFEQKMSAIKALLSPADAAKYGAALGDLGLQLGKDTVFTPGEAAAGIAELVRAGVSAQAVLDGVARAALNLAAATGIAVPDAATIAATAMNAFHIGASGAEHAMDTLAGAANASAATMDDLRYGLQSVGAVAAISHLSLEDTTAALAVLANNGLRGQDAGTSLKTMLMNLVPQTTKAGDEMRRLGIITEDGSNQFFDAAGRMKDMASVAEVLKKALATMTPEEQVSSLHTMFGTDAIRASSILGTGGGAGITQMSEDIAKIKVADVAKVQLDNLAGSLEQLKGSVETAAISLVASLGPSLRFVVDLLTNLVNRFANLPPGVQALIVGALVAAAVLTTLAGAFILIAPGIALVIGALPAVGAAAVAIAPFLLALIAILGAIYLVATHWTQVRTIIAGALNAIADAVPAVLFVLNLLFRPLILLGLYAKTLAQLFIDNFDVIRTTVSTVVNDVLGFLGRLLKGIGAALGPLAAALGGVLGGPAAELSKAINGAVASGGGDLAGLQSPLQAGLRGAASTVSTSDPFSAAMVQAQGIIDQSTGPSAARGTVYGSSYGQLTSATNAPITVNGPLVQTGPITGEGDEDRLADKVFDALLRAGGQTSNVASKQLPGS